ncbi:hypothetical protein GDO86_017447 [Hymenochirus boettgeri]|uniref:LTD domain-containing protein n=1 Tax=Hymenochirus boettgeri TaxID=247094 RepID=A0A8T2IQ06_9PIPI|nr:hypothetical protein GDO86_017447 [Hymenochirus boettgeri]
MGFFLIGSIGVNPRPSIILQPNTIQNGPDAIVLYFGKGPYRESMRVTREGLVDALVHKAKGTDQADVLQSVLTPGLEAFMEDASFHPSDESIGRCLELDGTWSFQMTHISPGSPNFCRGFPEIVISEIPSPLAQDLFIEIQGPPNTLLSGLVLAFISGEDQEVYYSTDIRGQTDRNGLYLLESEKYQNRAQQTLPDSVHLISKGAAAVALYLGKSSQILPKSPVPTSGLVDVFVYINNESLVSQPLHELAMGHPIIYWHSRDGNISASRCNRLGGTPNSFQLGPSTPGQINDCDLDITQSKDKLCLRISDCSILEGDQALSHFVASLAQTIKVHCQCNVSAESFTDISLDCKSNLLILHTPENFTLNRKTLEGTITISGRNTTVEPTCFVSTTTSKNAGPSSEAPPASAAPDLLINEVNPNTPGSAEDTEYVELYSPRGISFSLDGYWLVFYNGKNNLAYLTLELKNNRTDNRGYFLVGSNILKPQPHILLPFNTIQNGADAVALYYRPGKGYRKNMELTSDGLVDAIIYASTANDDAKRLLKILAPGQDVVHEDEKFLVEDESLSRCHGHIALNQASFQVTKITPLAENDCRAVLPTRTFTTPVTSSRPVPTFHPVTVVLSEVGLSRGPELYDFIELKGLPGAKLLEHTVVLYSMDGKVYDRFKLQGLLGKNGIYVISDNDTLSDQLLPSLSHPNPFNIQALALYRGTPDNFPVGSSVTLNNLLDAVVYTWENGADSNSMRNLSKDKITLHGDQRVFSISRCPYPKAAFKSLLLPVLHPSPGLENLCPSSVTSLKLDFCIKNASLNVQLTCTQTKLSISASIMSYHIDKHLIESWNTDLLMHPLPFTLQERGAVGSFTTCLIPEKVQGSFKTWHMSVLFVLLVLVLCAVVGVVLYLQKRRPQNYTSIEMNPHQELTSDY